MDGHGDDGDHHHGRRQPEAGRQAGPGRREPEPHRRLDEHVAGRGSDEGGGEPDDEQPVRVANVGALGVEHQEDRPVEEVGAVADLPQSTQRGEGEQSRDGPAGEGGHDDDRGERGVERGHPVEQGRRTQCGRVPQQGEAGERGRAREADRGPGPSRTGGQVATGRGDRVGQQHPDQDLARPGERGEVDEPAAGAPASGQQPGGAERGERQDAEHRGFRPPARRAEGGADRHEGQREQQVELLLDGQRPHVRHRRRVAEQQRVVAGGGGEAPVGRVAERRQQVAPEGRRGPGREHGLEQDDRRHRHQQGRQQAPRPPLPEPGEREPPGAVPLGQGERGDQEPRQREEARHPQEPAPRRGEPGVEPEHRQQRQPADPVERRHIPERRVGRAGVDARGGCRALSDLDRHGLSPSQTRPPALDLGATPLDDGLAGGPRWRRRRRLRPARRGRPRTRCARPRPCPPASPRRRCA